MQRLSLSFIGLLCILTWGLLIRPSQAELPTSATTQPTAAPTHLRPQPNITHPPTTKPNGDIAKHTDPSATSIGDGQANEPHAKLPSSTSTQRNSPRSTAQNASSQTSVVAPDDSIEKQISSEFVRDVWSRGWLFALLLIMLGGFLVSLTPCVYPMIPITIAVIGASRTGKQAKTGASFWLALLYVLGMALPYMILGVSVSLLGKLPFVLGGAFFNNPFFLGFLVLLFGLMSLSMFGVFDLTLPSTWQTRLASFQGKGWIGIFVLGIIGAFLATPCSGPVIIGLLAFIAQTGNIFFGLFLPLVFALGMGIPFLILGGGAVEALPRSGKWMNEVKKLFGVILLAAAFLYAYYLFQRLSIDISYYASMLAIALLFFSVSVGAFRPYATQISVWERFKQVFALLCLFVGIYLLVGTLLWKGFLLPPWSEWSASTHQTAALTHPTQQDKPPRNTNTEHIPADTQHTSSNPVTPKDTTKATVDPCLPPPDLAANKPHWLYSETEGVQCAQKHGRPMIIDFWAEWCTACKELERKSFNHPDVVRESRRFVLVKYEYTEKTPEDRRLRTKY